MSEAWASAYDKLKSLVRRLDHIEERLQYLRQTVPHHTIKIQRMERVRERVKQRCEDVNETLMALHV